MLDEKTQPILWTELVHSWVLVFILAHGHSLYKIHHIALVLVEPISHSQNRFVTCSYSCPHELTSHSQNQFVTCFLLLSSWAHIPSSKSICYLFLPIKLVFRSFEWFKCDFLAIKFVTSLHRLNKVWKNKKKGMKILTNIKNLLRFFSCQKDSAGRELCHENWRWSPKCMP